MNEEICKNCKYHYMEEISFDYPQSCCNKTNPNHTTEEWLHCDCFEYSKNYITNLQQKVEQLEKENKRLNNIIGEIERLIINHNCDTGDIYYKYNGKYLKSELKERIMELVELKENK